MLSFQTSTATCKPMSPGGNKQWPCSSSSFPPPTKTRTPPWKRSVQKRSISSRSPGASLALPLVPIQIQRTPTTSLPIATPPCLRSKPPRPENERSRTTNQHSTSNSSSNTTTFRATAWSTTRAPPVSLLSLLPRPRPRPRPRPLPLPLRPPLFRLHPRFHRGAFGSSCSKQLLRIGPKQSPLRSTCGSSWWQT